MILGIGIGIVLIVAFARHENVRSKHRSDLAKTIAEFARMTMEDSRKLLPSKFYPSWVVFTKRQKLNWLNSQLRRIWSHVDEAASELIRTIVEPILEQYRPIILSSLTFSKLTLGTAIRGDLSALPGISDAIEETIKDAIEDSITWP
ncbi:unnamed protein product, partial [Sphenostylis stenocarpa]